MFTRSAIHILTESARPILTRLTVHILHRCPPYPLDRQSTYSLNRRAAYSLDRRSKYSFNRRATDSLARGFCVAWCWGGGHVKWCHEVAKLVLTAACNYICTDSFEIQAKRAYYDEEESENGLRTSPYRLSHFVAPLYVAPSTTPSNATSHRRVN